MRDILGVGEHRLELLQLATAPRSPRRGPITQHALAERDGDVVRIERALGGNSQSPRSSFLPTTAAAAPAAVEVSRTCTSISERFSSTTMIDVEAAREGRGAAGSSGHGQPILNRRMPRSLAFALVDAEFVERLAHVEIALADGDDAELRLAPPEVDDAVELVGLDEGERRRRA
jgi:hypothetical protein